MSKGSCIITLKTFTVEELDLVISSLKEFGIHPAHPSRGVIYASNTWDELHEHDKEWIYEQVQKEKDFSIQFWYDFVGEEFPGDLFVTFFFSKYFQAIIFAFDGVRHFEIDIITKAQLNILQQLIGPNLLGFYSDKEYSTISAITKYLDIYWPEFIPEAFPK
jgi:hypothetical protein